MMWINGQAWRRFRRNWFPDATIRALRRELRGMGTVLDVGCGSDSPLQFVKGIGRLVGLDAFEESIAEARARGLHHEYRVMPIESMDFPPRSFDAVVALDVLEHFGKEEGAGFLEKIEAVASYKVVIFTPNGFLPQAKVGGNPWQEHKSGWTVKELQSRGYRVRGTLGWKQLRGELHRPRFRPIFIWERVARATAVFTANRPECDAALFAVKEKGK